MPVALIDNRSPRPAGLLRRLLAILYDSLLVAALLFVLTGVLIALRGGNAIGTGSGWYQALLVLACWLYFAWSWCHGGQTVGMRAWRLRVENVSGGPIGWAQATGRFLAAWLSAVPLALGFFWCWLDRDALCWHDRLSGTRLLHIRKQRTVQKE